MGELFVYLVERGSSNCTYENTVIDSILSTEQAATDRCAALELEHGGWASWQELAMDSYCVEPLRVGCKNAKGEWGARPFGVFT